jgi:membrane protein implicated in regulation of membrane protease activity
MDWLVWLIVGVVLLGVEAVSLAFVAVYFGIAALVAALVAGLGGPLWLQVAVFCVVSLLGLVLTRRIAKQLMRGPAVKTNIHRLVGRRGIVTKEIPADVGQGQIQVGTEYWTARPFFEDGHGIPEGAKVEVVKVDGVTAVVLQIE